MAIKSVSIKDEAMIIWLQDKDFSKLVRDLISKEMNKGVEAILQTG